MGDGRAVLAAPRRRRSGGGVRGGEEERAPGTGVGGEEVGGLRRYEGWVEAKRAGAIGYTVRVVPHHRLLANVAEMGLVTLPAAQTTAPPDFTPMR